MNSENEQLIPCTIFDGSRGRNITVKLPERIFHIFKGLFLDLTKYQCIELIKEIFNDDNFVWTTSEFEKLVNRIKTIRVAADNRVQPDTTKRSGSPQRWGVLYQNVLHVLADKGISFDALFNLQQKQPGTSIAILSSQEDQPAPISVTLREVKIICII